MKVFLTIFANDRRIRIQEAQKHVVRIRIRNTAKHCPKLGQSDLTWGRRLEDGRRAAGVEGDQSSAALGKLDRLQRRLLSRGGRRGGRGPRCHTEAGVRLIILITRHFEQYN
jgi:hypothetical protein